MKIEHKKQCVALEMSQDVLTVCARFARTEDRYAAVDLPLELRLRLEQSLLGPNSCLTLALLRLASSRACYQSTMASPKSILAMSDISHRWVTEGVFIALEAAMKPQYIDFRVNGD